jgi:hypothetical protein
MREFGAEDKPAAHITMQSEEYQPLYNNTDIPGLENAFFKFK